MTEKQRNALLASMTDEVGRLVLADNYEQNLALASAEAVAGPLMHVHESWIRRLERRGSSTARSSSCRRRRSSQARRAAGQSLTAPELAVLLAYTKIVLAQRAARAPTCRTTRSCVGELFGYFPTQHAAGLPRRRWSSIRCGARSS